MLIFDTQKPAWIVKTLFLTVGKINRNPIMGVTNKKEFRGKFVVRLYRQNELQNVNTNYSPCVGYSPRKTRRTSHAHTDNHRQETLQ